MDDEAFLDEIYAVWARTTGAENMYYMPVEYEDRSGRFRVYAVGEGDVRKLVAESMSDQDSDFLTAIHGCLADLVRRLHTAIDESARLDTERDEQEIRIAKLEVEADERDREIADLLAKIPEELL